MLNLVRSIKDRLGRAQSIAAEIDTPEKKRLFNQQHFAVSAKRYDLATGAMSLGRDRFWKKQLINILPQGGAPRCLDLASGSGDIAFLLGTAYPQGSIVGVDLTSEMVQLAQQRNRHSNVDFICADMAETGFGDATFDIVTGSYALRNAADPAVAVTEVYRLLKPGGSAAFLDFSKAQSPVLQRCQYRLLKNWCGLWGLLLHGDPSIHAYIADSLRQFPDRIEFHRLIRRNGFQLVSTHLLYGGMLELVLVRKA